MVNKHSSVKVFAERPLASLILAVLMVFLGIVIVSGWIPTSSNRPYFPGRVWILAAGCWIMALFLGYCARVGMVSDRYNKDL